MIRGKNLKAWVKRCRKMNNTSSIDCDKCWQWVSSFTRQGEKEASIPSDVPKGHLAVYVGENQRRFVIKVKLLKHPLFNALLDEYEFISDSRFYIPCDEDVFLDVVRCATTPTD